MVLTVLEMQPWQKVLLLTSYPDLRHHVDPLYLIDDMIQHDIIDIPHRREIQLLNQLERIGWLIWRMILNVGTEQCYNSFMEVLQQNEPKIFQVLKDKEDSLKNSKYFKSNNF